MARPPHRRGAPAASASPVEAAIVEIGSGGDGLGQTDDAARLHVPRTLPGELATVQPEPDGRRATLLQLLRASPERTQPPCPHFDELCGGCALQHWADTPYAAWKRSQVAAALTRAGYPDPPLGPLIRTPPAVRRRMDFAAERTTGGVLFGLHRAHGRAIVDLHICPVLDPTLAALIDPLRQTLRGLAALRRQGSVLANLLADGADLLIRTDGPLAPTDRAKLSAFAGAHNIRRIAWGPLATAPADAPTETASMLAAPAIIFGGVRIEPPAGAFLQASPQGEAAIVAAVLDSVPDRLTGRSRAVELYAGIGTISFPLATRLRVQAYEGDPDAAACVRRAQTGTRVEMTQRDLVRQPLSAKELRGAALVVLDPPYAGAAAQIPAIVASDVARVAYVSCNPGALARDAAILAEGGFRLCAAVAIDQFLWSAQVECVATFER